MNSFVNLPDATLATYVDEYVRRAVEEVRRYDELNKQSISIGITATQYGSEGEFTVKHRIQVGDSYSDKGIHCDITSDNIIRGAHLCCMRLVTDLQTPPKSYSALLPAPVEEQLTDVVSDPFSQEEVDVDAAEFHPIEDSGEEQVSTFMQRESGEAVDPGDETDS